MDSYKASKAWHFGHSLALDVHEVAKQLPQADKFHLAEALREVSVIAPAKIAESIERKLRQEKLECYTVARDAVNQLQVHLSLARDLRYIEQNVYEELSQKAIVAYQLLSSLIRSTSKV